VDQLADLLMTILLALCCLAGVATTAVRLPGTWWIVATALLFAWLMGTEVIAWGLVGVLALAALVGEVIETLMSALLAKRVGASRHAQIGGILGGFLGMIFLSFLVPVPLLGSIMGALLGCCGGAATAELYVRRRLGQSTRVGLASAIGFALGTAAKTTIALVMAALLVGTAIRKSDSDAHSPATPGAISTESG